MKENKKLREYLKMLELGKTDERIQFEATHSLYVYSIREANRYGYEIDSVYPGYKEDDPEKFAQTVGFLRLRARLNMGEVRAIWLPNEIVANHEWMDENKEILEKYSFKL